MSHGSNWSVDEIAFGEYKFLQSQSQYGSDTFLIIVTLRNEKAVINLDVDYKQCFSYSVLYSLHVDEITNDHHRASKYDQYLPEINMNGIDESMEIFDIAKFERKKPQH